MLGWEYPPHISGGLGTACEGLTRSLARLGVEITFVVPHLFGDETAEHISLVSPRFGREQEERLQLAGGSIPVPLQHIAETLFAMPTSEIRSSKTATIQQIRIPAFLMPYWNAETFQQELKSFQSFLKRSATKFISMPRELLLWGDAVTDLPRERYGHNIFDEVRRFTAQVLCLADTVAFDVIHAHDWMTFPAAVALAEITRKPLIVHVHSLEYDRSGHHINHQIHQIEHMGLARADRVIAVSYYTSSIIQKQHHIPEQKIGVVHNGVYAREIVETYRKSEGAQRKTVLFLGRVTFQKGPDYFVEAAAKVIPLVPDVLFVMAGAGDMLGRMVERVRQLGITDHFRFPGFLRGEDVEEMFSTADLYVMPSVSEPFGISALEAISFDTPVILSKQSGVSEVLRHVLKVDFWDIEKMADLIINALLYPELREDMITMAREEVKRLRWDAAAVKVLEQYRRFLKP